MSAIFGIAVRRATGLLGNIMRRRLLPAMMLLAFAWSPAPVMASVAGSVITLSVVVLNAPAIWGELSLPTYTATVRPVPPPPYTFPYVFDATLQIPGDRLLKGDLYFGFIPPAGNNIFTWTVDGGTPALKAGLIPVARAIDLRIAASFNVSGKLGQAVEYTFTGGEPPGMYLIFALLVGSGEDPSDANHWFAADVWPLIFRP